MGFEQLRPLIYGLLMICSVLFLPKGLESVVQRFLRRREELRLKQLDELGAKGKEA